MTARDDIIAALRALDGVADAEIVDDVSGAGTLRLTLEAGADEVAVALAVRGRLHSGFGLDVDDDRFQVVEETWPGAPAMTAAADAPPASKAPQPTSSTAAQDAGQIPAQVPAAGAEPDGAADGAADGAPDDAAPPAAHPGFTPTVAQAPLVGDRRPAIKRLQVVSGGNGISTAVSLALGADVVVGRASTDGSPALVPHAVAVATVRAVEQVVGGDAHLDVERVEVSPLGAEQVAIVVVLLTADGRTDRLTGASVVREDLRQAVIRAALDAVNRRVEGLLHRAPA